MIKITIATDNDAFAYGNLESEVARILTELAQSIATQYLPTAKVLRDINGNRVGSCEVTEDAA